MGDAPPPLQTAIQNRDESWAQWFRSDKSLLLGLYVFLVILLLHVSHDPADKDIVPFMREGATGAFSGLMVALRGTGKGSQQ